MEQLADVDLEKQLSYIIIHYHCNTNCNLNPEPESEPPSPKIIPVRIHPLFFPIGEERKRVQRACVCVRESVCGNLRRKEKSWEIIGRCFCKIRFQKSEASNSISQSIQSNPIPEKKKKKNIPLFFSYCPNTSQKHLLDLPPSCIYWYVFLLLLF